MTKATVMGATAVLVIGLGLAACGSDSVDPTVIIEMEPAPAQPWTASGELVDAGELCPAGDRANVGLAFPDGSPMTVEQLMELYGEAWDAGGSPMDVPRVGWEEYRCGDGSGTFTMREAYTPTTAEDGVSGEVVKGTGAYVDMTGSCVIVLTENADRTDLLEIVSTCEFEFPPTE